MPTNDHRSTMGTDWLHTGVTDEPQQVGKFTKTEATSDEDLLPSLTWELSHTWAYDNKYKIYSNLLVVTLLKAIWKFQCFELHTQGTSHWLLGAGEMLLLLPKFRSPSTRQVTDHHRPSSLDYQHQPLHLCDFDPTNGHWSTHDGISHSLQKALPQIVPFQVSSECNLQLEFMGILSHSNKEVSVLLHISFPYIC